MALTPLPGKVIPGTLHRYINLRTEWYQDSRTRKSSIINPNAPDPFQGRVATGGRCGVPDAHLWSLRYPNTPLKVHHYSCSYASAETDWTAAAVRYWTGATLCMDQMDLRLSCRFNYAFYAPVVEKSTTPTTPTPTTPEDDGRITVNPGPVPQHIIDDPRAVRLAERPDLWREGGCWQDTRVMGMGTVMYVDTPECRLPTLPTPPTPPPIDDEDEDDTPTPPMPPTPSDNSVILLKLYHIRNYINDLIESLTK